MSEQTVEDRAREQGWVPQDQFQGDPNKWRDAEEFLRFADNHRPILKERLEHTTAQLNETRKQVAELQATINDFKQLKDKIYQDAARKAQEQLKQLKVAQAEAVRDADGERFAAISERIEEVRQELVQTEKEPEKEPEKKPEAVADDELPPHIVQAVKEFQDEHPWYGKDKKRTALWDSLASIRRQEGDISVGKVFIDRVTKDMQEEYPELFGEKPAERKGSPVEGSTSAGRGSKGKKSFDSLPEDAKAACDRQVRAGMVKDRAEYVRIYFGE